MHDKVVIYHNPRCSKSRQTLQLLRERGIEPEVVEYLKTPPSPAELKEILERLGLEPRQLMRRKEAEYRTSGADDESLDQAQLIRILHEHPKLIERPIVLAAGRAAIGRPPEQVLEIL
ncbi:arsenate reductase (glutaredoxin) [Thiohalobacter sp. IOR34]|uniref:arsenate reductase (glutaredoxin) n=1 Tax=Thiohalobacter sp. IOR34 TaxID=3057176 RepID=UPI0025AF6A71|nr:arsenate reductase (glutaredoxin) [Thiohalobacter sp. IOR34]WJW76069.1 arsenate reductase (glutaredoxin) [Thiohalobacter sp. IOR34]